MALRDRIEEDKWNPLSQCENFYIELTHISIQESIGKELWAPEEKKHELMEKLEIGDCVLHYLTSKSRSIHKQSIVGVSRVSKKPVKLSKDDLINKLKEIGVWSEEYEKSVKEWLDKSNSFYFVELSNYIEFPRKIPFKEFSNLTGIKYHDLQGRYLIDLPSDYAKKILELAYSPIGMGKIAWSHNDW
ncbi:MAG: hypothetical protein ACO2OS_03670, partial [Thermosphaera aggregans]|uniref:hypothetical protein n=1 Tax=Thermosphaera aggregans TaxID=54254 RepID=UPI003C0BADCD